MFKSMSPEEYINKRLTDQANWYNGKAAYYKRRFFVFRVLASVGAILVPVAANVIPDFQISKYVTTLTGLMVSIAVAVDTIYRFGDQWKNYRSTEQFLSRERFLFQTGEGPYKTSDAEEAFVLLVERCEGQIAAENSATLNVIVTATQQPEPAAAKAG